MKRPLSFALAIPLVLGLAASAGEEKASTGFAGTWTSDYGELVLEERAGFVSGFYEAGTLRGTVEGRTLHFRFHEAGTRGGGTLTLGTRAKRFTGKWRNDGEAWQTWSGTRRVPKPAKGFTGLWETPYGRIRLVPGKGGELRGLYEYSGSLGELKGRVKRGTLHVNWSEGASRGQARFTLAKQGRRLVGKWWSEGDSKKTPWRGRRVRAKAGQRWLVVLEAHWEAELREHEYSFGGMLRAFLGRHPRVSLRHRRFGDLPDLRRALRQVAFLAGPVVLVVASHGTKGTLVADGESVPAQELGKHLALLPNLKLLHFSACDMIVGDTVKNLRASAGAGFPVSGYAVSVDWTGSAILEFLYFDLILGRGYTPAKAAAALQKDLAFAGDTAKGGAIAPAKFRFVK